MRVRVNGKEEELPDAMRLDELLQRMQIDRRYLVVEHNGEPLAREQMVQVVLCDGDRLELVRPVAGG